MLRPGPIAGSRDCLIMGIPIPRLYSVLGYTPTTVFPTGHPVVWVWPVPSPYRPIVPMVRFLLMCPFPLKAVDSMVIRYSWMDSSPPAELMIPADKTALPYSFPAMALCTISLCRISMILPVRPALPSLLPTVMRLPVHSVSVPKKTALAMPAIRSVYCSPSMMWGVAMPDLALA